MSQRNTNPVDVEVSPHSHGNGTYEKTVVDQRTAFFEDQACTLVLTHAPRPVMTEYHHSKPVYLQNRLYGKILYGADTWLCSNCHDAVHAWIYWLLGERRQPPYIGRAAKAEAQRTVDWFRAEQARLFPPTDPSASPAGESA